MCVCVCNGEACRVLSDTIMSGDGVEYVNNQYMSYDNDMKIVVISQYDDFCYHNNMICM